MSESYAEEEQKRSMTNYTKSWGDYFKEYRGWIILGVVIIGLAIWYFWSKKKKSGDASIMASSGTDNGVKVTRMKGGIY